MDDNKVMDLNNLSNKFLKDGAIVLVNQILKSVT